MERVRAQYAPLGVDAADKGDLVIKEKRGSIGGDEDRQLEFDHSRLKIFRG